jgi:DNA polymerase V
MGFPVPGDAIEQSLDLDRYLIHNPTATFFMRVEGDAAADDAVLPGDLLIVDRSLEAQQQSLVVGVIEGQLVVLRVGKQGQKLVPLDAGNQPAGSFEIWGVVTNIIRKV